MNLYIILSPSNIFDKIYNCPLPYKIMTFLFVKNVSNGIYRGIIEFNSSSKPITNLYNHIVLNTFCGIVEGLFWPLFFPYNITYICDKIVYKLKNK